MGQIETAVVELTWMWQELDQLTQEQEQAMKKVNLKLDVTATMTDANGKVMASFPLGGEYHDLPYDKAVEIQSSLAQAMTEHGQRMLNMGKTRAAELVAADATAAK